MRIVLLTPGTGSFFCGTCMRDNALALALRRLGHDALMVPLYLPPTLDEASAAENAPLFYGGINVYLQQQSGLFRSTPRWLDKLLDSPAALQGAAKRAGMTQARDLGPMTVSMLEGERGKQVKELERLAQWLEGDGKADAVILSNALLIGMGRRLKATGAKVYCTLQGEDTFLDGLPEPHRTRAWEIAAERATEFDGFFAVSRWHAELMGRRLRLAPAKVHTVYNGIALDGYGPAPERTGAPTIGYLARMCPPKGLHTLVDAFVLLGKRNPEVRLHVAGAQTPADIPYVDEQKAKLRDAGLLERATFTANIDRDAKIAYLQSLTALSVPATYGESFGLYVLESLAAGTPVVQPRHAVFPELLAETGGGLLCEPDDTSALADALESLVNDPARARALGAEGRASVHGKFHVDAMAAGVLAPMLD